MLTIITATGLLVAIARSSAASAPLSICPGAKFCGLDPATGKARTFDLSSLPNKTFTLHDVGDHGPYKVGPPCGCVGPGTTLYGHQSCVPMTQGSSRGLGTMLGIVSVSTSVAGLNVTLGGGDNDPQSGMPHGRNAVYHFVCDKSKPLSNPPNDGMTESPSGFYNVVWRHPAACAAPTPRSLRL
eukprot:SAG22_NODE_3137_length_1908_cov_3.132117_1_plen_184_part_00